MNHWRTKQKHLVKLKSIDNQTSVFEKVQSKENSASCLPCLICESQVYIDKMRYHIGLHIINGEAEKSVCGASGTKCGNQMSMKQGSKKVLSRRQFALQVVNSGHKLR
jgi:hypothetical protein